MLRRLLPLVCALGIFGSATFAQPLPDRVPLRGVVVDETGRPVPSAVLIVRRQDENGPTAFWGAEVRADEKGQFFIPNAEAGHYFVSVEASGFAPLSNFAFDWKAGEAGARLPMVRLTRLGLRILSPDGKPLANAPLWLRLRGADGTLRPERAQTDVDGKVTLANVVPSIYSLVAVASTGIAIQTNLQINTQSTSPTEVHLIEGATLRIKATDTNNAFLGGASLILFAQSPEETTRLGGEGADPGDNWALVGAANAPQALVSRDGDGSLELKHLPPGKFSGRLLLSGYGATPRDLVLENGNVAQWDATFPKRSAATLTLHVKDSSGKSISNARVALRLLPLANNGTFADAQTEFPDPNSLPDVPIAALSLGNRVAQTDENGNLILFPLLPGRFRVFASRPSADSWLRAAVAPEGEPIDVAVSLSGPNKAEVQVP